MFDHKPSQEEISKWFAGFKLHTGLKHEQYVGGIVAIENRDRGGSIWMLYINATARISYFWDWIEVNGYNASIDVTAPIERDVELPDDKKARLFYMEAKVLVENPESHHVIREAVGRKQVESVKFKRGFNGAPGRIVPDTDSLMKAETGAIARALGTIGMLALPGSGLATAEDMSDYLAANTSDVHSNTDAPRKTKAAPNPKK